jgi:hypothetical protein
MVNTEREQLISDLKAARAVLVKRGRCKGTRIAGDGSVCVKGAIGVATVFGFAAMRGNGLQDAALAEDRPWNTTRALEKYLGGRFVWEFNDDPATTDQDVLELFEKALADLGGMA